MPLFKGTAGKAKPKKAIDYVTDPKKAVIVTSLSMDDNYDYAKQFTETCKMYGKGNGFNERKYYHFKLSPDQADNATPQQCHELAERMAKELFSAHECVIATHNDTDTVHSHIIVNAVSFETGKKFHMNLFEYRDSKDLADILGEEFGFTPLDWKTKTGEKLDRLFADEAITADKKYLSHAEQQIAKRDKTGNASWKETLRQAIDEAKTLCTNRAEFQQYLQNTFGIIMPRNTAKAVSFIHPAVGENYAIRGNKLGSDYTADSIDQALQNNYERGAENARLYHAEEQYLSSQTATITDTNPDGTTTGEQQISNSGCQNRPAPRSSSDINSELRSLDEAISRIAGRSTENEPEIHSRNVKPYAPSDRNNSLTQGRVNGSNGEAVDRDIQRDMLRTEHIRELPETTGHNEPNVHTKPKKRARGNDR